MPSVRLVKQTMLQTSSCQIMFQKSAIVFGFGPYKYKKENIIIYHEVYDKSNRNINEIYLLFKSVPWEAM